MTNEIDRPVPVDVSPKERAASVLAGLKLGKTLQEIQAETGVSIIEFYDVLDADPDAAAAFDKARMKGAISMVDEVTTRIRELLAEPAKNANAIKTLQLCASHFQWIAERYHKEQFSNKPALIDNSTKFQVIQTTLDLGDGKGSRPPQTLEAEDAYALPAIAPPTDAPFEPVGEQGKQEALAAYERDRAEWQEQQRAAEQRGRPDGFAFQRAMGGSNGFGEYR